LIIIIIILITYIIYIKKKLQYHLYTSPLLPHMSSTQNQRTIHSFFIPDKLREELQKRNEAITHVLNSDCKYIYKIVWQKQMTNIKINLYINQF